MSWIGRRCGIFKLAREFLAAMPGVPDAGLFTILGPIFLSAAGPADGISRAKRIRVAYCPCNAFGHTLGHAHALASCNSVADAQRHPYAQCDT